MWAYDKLAKIVIEKRASWILLLLFNLYLTFTFITITGPYFMDVTIMTIYLFLLFLINGNSKINNHKSLLYYLDFIVLIIALILLIFYFIFPNYYLIFSQLPISKQPFHAFYIIIIIELMLARNIIRSYI